jgi:hypothetical protein
VRGQTLARGSHVGDRPEDHQLAPGNFARPSGSGLGAKKQGAASMIIYSRSSNPVGHAGVNDQHPIVMVCPAASKHKAVLTGPLNRIALRSSPHLPLCIGCPWGSVTCTPWGAAFAGVPATAGRIGNIACFSRNYTAEKCMEYQCIAVVKDDQFRRFWEVSLT